MWLPTVAFIVASPLQRVLSSLLTHFWGRCSKISKGRTSVALLQTYSDFLNQIRTGLKMNRSATQLWNIVPQQMEMIWRWIKVMYMCAQLWTRVVMGLTLNMSLDTWADLWCKDWADPCISWVFCWTCDQFEEKSYPFAEVFLLCWEMMQGFGTLAWCVESPYVHTRRKNGVLLWQMCHWMACKLTDEFGGWHGHPWKAFLIWVCMTYEVILKGFWRMDVATLKDLWRLDAFALEPLICPFIGINVIVGAFAP